MTLTRLPVRVDRLEGVYWSSEQKVIVLVDKFGRSAAALWDKEGTRSRCAALL